MSDHNIYLKFLKETKESEIEIGHFAHMLSQLLLNTPKKMRMSQAFNIIYKFAHRTPGWKLIRNKKNVQVIRRSDEQGTCILDFG